MRCSGWVCIYVMMCLSHHIGWYNVREETFVTEAEALESNYVDKESGR